MAQIILWKVNPDYNFAPGEAIKCESVDSVFSYLCSDSIILIDEDIIHSTKNELVLKCIKLALPKVEIGLISNDLLENNIFYQVIKPELLKDYLREKIVRKFTPVNKREYIRTITDSILEDFNSNLSDYVENRSV